MLQFAHPPRLKKFPRLLHLSNNDMESECLTSEGLIHPGLKPAQTSDLTLISQVSVDP